MITQLPGPNPCELDLEIMEILKDRTGCETIIELRTGSFAYAIDYAWGYDTEAEYAHVTTNCSPGDGKRELDSFFTDEVVKITDQATGEVLFDLNNRKKT